MADLTWPEVGLITGDSSFDDVSLEAQTEILGYVNTHLNTTRFATYDLKMARVYLAAHMGLGALPEAASGSAGGAVASESGGDGLAVSYSVSPQAALDSLGETAWGRRYLSLARTSCAGGVLL